MGVTFLFSQDTCFGIGGWKVDDEPIFVESLEAGTSNAGIGLDLELNHDVSALVVFDIQSEFGQRELRVQTNDEGVYQLRTNAPIGSYTACVVLIAHPDYQSFVASTRGASNCVTLNKE